MGQDFCKGCEDCTNFKNNEGDLSYFANKPLTNLNNPFFQNGTIDNSILNKTDFQNDTSFLTNNNNNLINQNKNETLQISSLNSKPINNDNDLSTNLLINTKFYQKDNNDIFKENNNENSSLHFDNHNDNFIFNNEEEDEIDQKRLEKVIKDYNSKIIAKSFKQFMQKKNESHKVLYTEYGSVNDSNYIQNNLRNELDVNLVPDKKYLYIGTKFNFKKDGLGLELFADSQAKYFGRFINGKRVWAGQFVINNDNYSYYYYGEIKGLYAYGFGWHENIKEQVFYEGMWENSKKEGYGIEKYNKDNSIYKGCFSKGKKDGIGYYAWNDNSSYMGEWSAGTLNGYGIYHFNDGSIYSGSWVNNKMDGLGEFTFPEIKTYFGYFEEDKRAGFGVLIWYKENKVFVGFWKENRQNGLGKFISNGKIRYGLWENGSLKQKIDNKESFNNKFKGEELNYLNFFKYNSFEDIQRRIKKILKI